MRSRLGYNDECEMNIREIIRSAPGAYYEARPGAGESSSLEMAYHDAYDDGRAKADRAIEIAELHKLVEPGASWSDVVYLSIGGSQGAELFAAADIRDIHHGVLMEYSPYACNLAEKRVGDSRLSELSVFSGDAWAARKQCNAHLRALVASKKARRVLVSANSVFHELPRRSEPIAYNHQKFLADLIEGIDHVCFVCREPTSFANWPKEVWISFPFLTGKELEVFLRFLSDRFSADLPHLSRHELVRAGDKVRCHRDLACEAIKKIVYRLEEPSLEILLYELGECHAAFDSQRFRGALEAVFSDDREWTGSVSSESMNSDAFRAALVKSGVAYKSEGNLALPTPLAFSLFVGSRSRKSGRSGQKAPEFEEYFGFGLKAAVPLSKPYAQECLAAFEDVTLVPDYDKLLRIAEGVDFRSAPKVDYIVLRVSCLLLDVSNELKVGVVHRSDGSHTQNAGVDSVLLSSELIETYGFLRTSDEDGANVIENPSFSFTRKLGAYLGAFNITQRAFACLRRQPDHSGHGVRHYAFLVYLAVRDPRKFLPDGFRLFSNVKNDRFDGFFDLPSARRLLDDGDLSVDKLALSLLAGGEACHTDVAGVSRSEFHGVLANVLNVSPRRSDIDGLSG